MKRSRWAQDCYDELKNTPEYISARLMIEINDKFCARMKELGLSQNDFAKRIGKSQPYVSRILNQGANMTLHTLALFAQALELDVEPPALIPKESSVYSSVMEFHSLSCDLKKQTFETEKISIYTYYVSDENLETEGEINEQVSNAA